MLVQVLGMILVESAADHDRLTAPVHSTPVVTKAGAPCAIDAWESSLHVSGFPRETAGIAHGSNEPTAFLYNQDRRIAERKDEDVFIVRLSSAKIRETIKEFLHKPAPALCQFSRSHPSDFCSDHGGARPEHGRKPAIAS